MTITDHWDLVSFHDADVQSQVIQPSDTRLTLLGVYVLPDHPSNPSRQPYLLHESYLVFHQPASISVHAYSSESGTWADVLQPYPIINSIAEVINGDKEWKITGFERGGPRWLELTIGVGRGVTLEA